ncbi:hypothetical protein ACWEFL_12195 [Streptomyces sp. NPDC004838]
MANERYEWLDKETAERLLRGEPVEALDERARIQVARLNQALYAAARPQLRTHPDDGAGEMPGEAAALAAFRKVRAEAATGGQSLGMVRIAPRPRSPFRTRLGLPVRFGVAAAVAGFAFGGVAVASGTGFLPSPFDGTPGPVSSVSAPTPDPLVTESPRNRKAVPPQPSGPAGTVGTPSATGDPGSESSDTDPPAIATGEAEGPGKGKKKGQQGKQGKRKTDRHLKTVKACEDYRDGTIDAESRKFLEQAAKGPARIREFCDRMLRGTGSGTGSGTGTEAEAEASESGGGDDAGNGDFAGSGGDTTGGGSHKHREGSRGADRQPQMSGQ